ncbi:polysaccharide deacetylase family protein [Lutibacter flavus]|uniref:Peptidoglycan/xylan/chitin deacetylase, PgdA/CDA1 family n=1 Tax=Lutibacter flavus TaxID=691689 RepID=A0A238YT05_9FLAO|nr:polysaccharide deacetylase family protein [Lutibacter flavus]SNR74082.1 Peptidoglycan/xylan/chitin deacetylase, PgdA/CDA1 family [Lutibacter flavus]
MKPYFIKTPIFIKFIFNKWVWSFSKKEKNIYLTFDDGPTADITEWTLNELNKYNAKATFFCIGKNIEELPELFQHISTQGHSIGNHTNNHLNGSKTSWNDYLLNFEKAEKHFDNIDTKLFRPPYGKLKISQAKKIRKKGYKIIMWDILSADFDTAISNKKCLENVIKNAQNGSIIVFHDSLKASEKLKYVLPKILEYYNAEGFTFKSIN